MLNEALLHPLTREALLAILQGQPHAILLRGGAGAGKGFIATLLAADILGCLPEDLSKQPYFLRIRSENDVIKIEQIRELKQFLQLKTTGTAEIRRLVIIEDAMLMGDEAQNAILKMIEEPPADTVLILTATNSGNLRPTIISRSQMITVQTPPKALTTEYFVEKGYDAKEVSKSLMISRGAIGLMQALLDSQDHPLSRQIELAKELLGADTYNRLIKVEALSKDRLGIEALLAAMTSICSTMLIQTAAANDRAKLERWYRTTSAVEAASQAFAFKPSAKLLLTDLFLQL